MNDSMIVCPQCKTNIPLTSAIEGPIAERLRVQFDAESKARELALVQRESSLQAKVADLVKAKLAQEEELASKLASEKIKLAAEAKKIADSQLQLELGDLRSQLAEKASKLETAQLNELELRKQRRELEQQKDAMALEVVRRVDEERAKIKNDTQKQLEVEFNRKEAEKDQQLLALRGQVTEAQTRAKALAEKEEAIGLEVARLNDERKNLNDQVAQKVAAERAKISEDALNHAKQIQAVELADLQSRLVEKDAKLANAQKLELELRTQRRELEEKKQAFELETARTLDAERERIRTATLRAADEAYRLKEAEKDKQLGDMRQQIELLKQKAEQGSQQLQGEVLELELERMLRAAFPHDQILPVATGAHGGDIVQKVRTPSLTYCGTILWESKRTKAWSDGWIEKLKGDQRAAKADLAVIISTALPKNCTHMTHIDGVWVASRECMMGMVAALRDGIVRLGEAKRAEEGKHEKMDVLYNYLSGHEFKQRVEAIVEAFTTMREDLEQEKRAITKIWAKREKQIERVMASTTGMYGDLSGIIGAALPAIAAIDLPSLLPAGEAEDQ